MSSFTGEDQNGRAQEIAVSCVLRLALGDAASHRLGTDEDQAHRCPERRRPAASLESSAFGAILQGMRELRYVEGRDFVMEWRLFAGHYDRVLGVLGGIVRLKAEDIL